MQSRHDSDPSSPHEKRDPKESVVSGEVTTVYKPRLLNHHLLAALQMLVASFGITQAMAQTKAPPPSPAVVEVATNAFTDSLSDTEREWLHAHPVIRVAQDPSRPPIEFTDASGTPSGMTADYLKLIEQRLGLKFERITNLSWQEAYARMQRREIDITTSVTVTPERETFWAFTKPYMTIPIVIVTRANVTYIADLRELAGKKVVVVDGHVPNVWIARDFPEIQLVRVNTTLEALAMLQRGEVFACAENMLIVGHYMAERKMTDLKIAGTTPYHNAQCMAVRKDWVILAGILDKALDSVSETERSAIYRKWLPLHYQDEFDHAVFWKVAAILVAFLLGLALWNWKLGREIRHRKLAEEALRQSSEQFRVVQELMPDGFTILRPVRDAQGRVVDFTWVYQNAVMARLNGTDPGTVIGKRLLELFPSHRGSQFLNVYQRVAETGESYVFEDCYQGETITNLTWFRIAVVPTGGDIAILAQDITQHKQAEAELRASEFRWKFATEGTGDGLWDWDVPAGTVYFSKRWKEMLGFADDEIGNSLEERTKRIHPDDLAAVMAAVKAHFDGQISTYANEHRVLCKDGSWKWILDRGLVIDRDAAGKPQRMIGTHSDITGRKQAEALLHRTDRALRMISECNQVVVRANSETALLQAICDIVVNHGGYRMAWVGFTETNEAKSVRPVAQAGFEAGYLETVNITWADTERGRGPVGTAIRTKQMVIAHDISRDPAFGPWRKEAIQRGYASLATLPLISGECAFGALSVYAAEPDAFNAEEVTLLTELAGDLAYGITALRIRAEHARAEAATIASETRYRRLFESAKDGILILDAGTGMVVDVNPFLVDLLGYSHEVFLGKKVWELGFFKNHIANEANFLELQTRQYIRYDDMALETNDGRRIEVEFVSNVYLVDGQKVIQCNIRDISERKRAEHKARQSHDLLTNLARMVPGVIYQYRLFPDGSSAFPYSSAGMIDIYEVTPEEVREDATPVFGRLHPDDYDRVAGLIQESARTLQMFYCEFRVILPRQGLRWRWCQAQPERMDDGGTLWHGIISDITERKHVEEALRESERNFQSLAEVVPQIVWATRPDGWCFYINQNWTRYSGIPLEECYGHGWIKPFHPDDRQRAWNAWQYATQNNAIYSLECRLRRADGAYRWWLIRGEPLRDEDGRILKWFGTCTDIDDIKQKEASHARLALAVEQASETIVITDTQGQILYANPAFEKTTGYTCAEAIGQNPRMLKSGGQDAAFYRQMWDTLNRGEVWTGRFSNKRKDGTLFEEEATISPIRDASGTIINYVAVKRDVTYEVNLESQLRQAQKMEAIGTMAGGIAHDFNNILAVIFGYSNLLQIALEENPEALAMIGEILKSGQRAKDLVQQILTFSQQREQERQVIHLHPILKETMKLLRASLPANFQIEMDLAADAPTVLADATQIYQVVMNLGTNALHAMEGMPTGRLSITLDAFQPDATCLIHQPMLRAIKYARLTVSDTGCGMDAKTVERIYEPFFTTKPLSKGSGLGLAVVHGIVEASDAVITVESLPGQGTTFRVYFPEQSLDMLEKGVAGDQASHGQGQSILMVDDELALAGMYQQLLTALRYEGTVVTSPKEAVRLVRENPAQFDVIITDLSMPEMSGLELARQIREIRADLPIILATGFHGTVTDRQLHEAGIGEVVDKPISMTHLAVVLRRWLGEKTIQTSGS